MKFCFVYHILLPVGIPAHLEPVEVLVLNGEVKHNPKRRRIISMAQYARLRIGISYEWNTRSRVIFWKSSEKLPFKITGYRDFREDSDVEIAYRHDHGDFDGLQHV